MRLLKTAGAMGIIVLLFAACQREKYYSCSCGINGGNVSYHTLGRMASETAYNECKTYEDSTTTCIMEIRR